MWSASRAQDDDILPAWDYAPSRAGKTCFLSHLFIPCSVKVGEYRPRYFFGLFFVTCKKNYLVNIQPSWCHVWSITPNFQRELWFECWTTQNKWFSTFSLLLLGLRSVCQQRHGGGKLFSFCSTFMVAGIFGISLLSASPFFDMRVLIMNIVLFGHTGKYGDRIYRFHYPKRSCKQKGTNLRETGRYM